MVQVIKRDGRKEQFEEDKVRASVKKALIDGGHKVESHKKEVERIVSIVRERAQEENPIPTAAIREAVLTELEGSEGEAAQAWKRFDVRYKGLAEA